MQDPKRYESTKSVADFFMDKYGVPMLNALKWSDNKSEYILDYGCGTGSTGYDHILPRVLKSAGSTLYSVDISKKMVDFAKEKYSHERIQYGIWNAVDSVPFPFENVSFDKIISINVLHVIRDLKEALISLRGIMKDEAELGFISSSISLWTFQSFEKLAQDEFWKSYMRGYESFMPTWTVCDKDNLKEHLISIFEDAGFAVTHLKVNYGMYELEMDTYLEFNMAVNPCFGNIPNNLHTKFKEDLRKILTEMANVPLGTTRFRYPYNWNWGILKNVKKP